MQVRKPAGFLCAELRTAVRLLHYARFLELTIPEQISILGIGCAGEMGDEIAHGVSVVEVDRHEQGLASVKLINDSIERAGCHPVVRLKPSGIRHHQTTIRCRTTDPIVRKVLCQAQSDPSLSVSEICAKVGERPRTVQYHFQTNYGMSLCRAIDYERLLIAKKLIRRLKSASVVAGLAGYSGSQQMYRSFMYFMGMSPREFAQDPHKRAHD